MFMNLHTQLKYGKLNLDNIEKLQGDIKKFGLELFKLYWVSTS